MDNNLDTFILNNKTYSNNNNKLLDLISKLENILNDLNNNKEISIIIENIKNIIKIIDNVIIENRENYEKIREEINFLIIFPLYSTWKKIS